MRKKCLIIGCISGIIFLALMICICPLPKKIDISLQGNSYTDQFKQAEFVDIHITGWALDWLFFTDQLKISVEIKDSLTGDEILKIRDCNAPILHHPNKEGIRWASLQYYSPKLNAFSHGSFAYDHSIENVCFHIYEGPIYLASVHQNIPAEKLRELFDFMFTE